MAGLRANDFKREVAARRRLPDAGFADLPQFCFDLVGVPFFGAQGVARRPDKGRVTRRRRRGGCGGSAGADPRVHEDGILNRHATFIESRQHVRGSGAFQDGGHLVGEGLDHRGIRRTQLHEPLGIGNRRAQRIHRRDHHVQGVAHVSREFVHLERWALELRRTAAGARVGNDTRQRGSRHADQRRVGGVTDLRDDASRAGTDGAREASGRVHEQDVRCQRRKGRARVHNRVTLGIQGTHDEPERVGHHLGGVVQLVDNDGAGGALPDLDAHAVGDATVRAAHPCGAIGPRLELMRGRERGHTVVQDATLYGAPVGGGDGVA